MKNLKHLGTKDDDDNDQKRGATLCLWKPHADKAIRYKLVDYQNAPKEDGN